MNSAFISPSFQRQAASFRDPSGFLFFSGSMLYRQVNQSYRQNYSHLMESGLYQALVDKGMLVDHHEVDIPPVQPELAYKIIQPENIRFISYPYEWCFSQLKDAALLTLAIQKKALEFGMSLKDSSAYNIQFDHGHPILIDTLSFELYNEGQPWIPYRQFCQHFLAPLSLMAYRDVRLSQLMRIFIDGVPLDLASRLLPYRSHLSLSLYLHIFLHASSQKRYASQQTKPRGQVSRVSLMGLVDSLESGIRKLHWSPSGTDWGDYYDEHNYTQEGLNHKTRIVDDYLATIQPGSVWDLGANTGLFSRLASQRGIPTISFDIDPGVVELNYLESRAKGEKDLLPLILDLTNPSPSLGWDNRERMSILQRSPADAVLALALIHHLAIANNVPLESLASFFHQLGRWLVIEFVPKNDSQVQRLLATREDIFPDYNVETFELIFSEKFTIHRIEAIKASERRLYLMERR